MEEARNADSSADGTADSCGAGMHIAGGETSAERPGITRMMFLVVFFCAAEMFGVFPQGPDLFSLRDSAVMGQRGTVRSLLYPERVGRE